MSNGRKPEPLKIDEEDQQELEHISLLRKEDEIEIEVDKWRPGKTEMDALLFLAFRGVLACALSCGIVGAVVGTPAYPVLGTIAGFVYTALLSFFVAPCFAVQYVILRGRVSIVSMMIWAAINSGIFCAIVGLQEGYALRYHRLDPGSLRGVMQLGVYLLIGIVCGVVTWMIAHRMTDPYLISEGRGTRPWWQFGIIDLLIQSTWIAALLVVIKILDSAEGLMELLPWLMVSAVITWLIRLCDWSARSRQSGA